MDRYSKTKLAGILGIIGNIFLLIIKAIIGFITSSQAMIADAREFDTSHKELLHYQLG